MTALRRIVVDEWEPIPLSGPGAISGSELRQLVEVWREISGRSEDGFFHFGSRAVRPRNWVGLLRGGEIELEVRPRNSAGLNDEQRALLDRAINEMLTASVAQTFASARTRTSGAGKRMDAAVSALCESVLLALRLQRLREYRVTADEAVAVRGRIDALRTDALQIRRPGFAVSRWTELSNDVPAARFVAGVLAHARPRVAPSTARYVDLVGEQIGRVQSTNLHADLARITKPRLPRAWRRAIGIAEDILLGRVGGLVAGSATGRGEVLYLPDLFQDFVALAFDSLLMNTGFTVSTQVQRSAGTWIRGGHVGLEPPPFVTDIEIRRAMDEVPAVVLDTKWKQLRLASPGYGIASDDLQQVAAYAVATGARTVSLVYPHLGDASPFEETPLLEMGEPAPLRVSVYCLPLLVPDVAREARGLVARLCAETDGGPALVKAESAPTLRR